MKTLIKGSYGQTKGFTQDLGFKTIITDKAGKTLGWYDHNTDKTFSASGTFIGYGNQIMILLQD